MSTTLTPAVATVAEATTAAAAEATESWTENVSIPGVVGIVCFYLLIVVVGVWAAYYKRNKGAGTESETIIVGGRDIGLFVGCFTMTGEFVT